MKGLALLALLLLIFTPKYLLAAAVLGIICLKVAGMFTGPVSTRVSSTTRGER